MTGPSALTPPMAEWDAIREVPGGATLIDAFLNLRHELQGLIVSAQMVGKGVSVEGLREEATALMPLLELGRGRDWTEAYWAMVTTLHSVTSPLDYHLELRAQGKYHDFPVEDAVKLLKRALPAGMRLPLHYSVVPGCGQCGGTGGLHWPGCIALAGSGEF